MSWSRSGVKCCPSLSFKVDYHLASPPYRLISAPPPPQSSPSKRQTPPGLYLLGHEHVQPKGHLPPPPPIQILKWPLSLLGHSWSKLSPPTPHLLSSNRPILTWPLSLGTWSGPGWELPTPPPPPPTFSVTGKSSPDLSLLWHELVQVENCPPPPPPPPCNWQILTWPLSPVTWAGPSWGSPAACLPPPAWSWSAPPGPWRCRPGRRPGCRACGDRTRRPLPPWWQRWRCCSPWGAGPAPTAGWPAPGAWRPAARDGISPRSINKPSGLVSTCLPLHGDAVHSRF